MRNFNCEKYYECLDYAARQNHRSFKCDGCEDMVGLAKSTEEVKPKKTRGRPKGSRNKVTGKQYMYGITRVDHIGKNGAQSHCWYVRLHIKKGKPLIFKTFYDSACGGMSQSLAAAVEFRDKNIKLKLVKRLKS